MPYSETHPVKEGPGESTHQSTAVKILNLLQAYVLANYLVALLPYDWQVATVSGNLTRDP